jgi:hydroxymethylbilane synthase
MAPTNLKLGTRRSLLAWAQSGWVAREIERLNPGVSVELVGIDTRGDQIQDVPLQAVEGKEFFVAEIDQALREGSVDLTVHSMKDLSLERPAEFVCAAVPKRENSRDVVLFGPGVMTKLANEQLIRIGTSSPRRLENLPSFLEKALPTLSASTEAGSRLEFVEIRGNVNTRLSRVHEPTGTERALDGVVLAFAGLIRLWRDEQAREEMKKLFKGVRWMVLPLRECPSAPAQGALAVECRANDPRAREVIARLHDAASAQETVKERQLLADWGGGCHQKFGASALRHKEVGELLSIRGRKPDGVFVDELRWKGPAPRSSGSVWDGGKWREQAVAATDLEVPPPAKLESVFISHARALPEDPRWITALGKSRVWTSGVASWFALAARGVWVDGCAESMGFSWLEAELAEPVLQLPAAWTVLTHEGAHGGTKEDWGGRSVLPTYRLSRAPYPAEAKAHLSRAGHIYWSSGSQFDELKDSAPMKATHSCGPGKTAEHLRKAGLKPVVFPSIEEWRKWAK